MMTDSTGHLLLYYPSGTYTVAAFKDGYLPDFDLWVEVKPNKSKLMDEEKKLCAFLKYDTQIARSNGLIILGQIPNYVEYDEDNEKCFFPAFPLFWSSSLIASSKVQFAKLDKT